MPNSYNGKVLFVDLSAKQFREKPIADDVYRQFLGGYGLGVRLLYENMDPGIDALSPANILGFVPGLLDGSGVLTSCRVSIVGKSPLTGTWGDSNFGSGIGTELKRAGYDAIFFVGKSEKPVYCLIDGETKEIREAGHLWGKDTYETVQLIRRETQQSVEVACIGKSGERLSLISCILGSTSGAAGRSGLGAIMGSKNLKAVAVRGSGDISVANRSGLEKLNEHVRNQVAKRPLWLSDLVLGMMLLSFPSAAKLRRPFPTPASVVARIFAKYGTCGGTAASAAMQDSPVKNWRGTSRDFPKKSKASLISDENVVKYEKEKYGCAGCPIKCGGVVELTTGKYALEGPCRKPEYETLASFGTLLLNSDVESIIYATDVCNRYGIDTISAGSAIAFAIECYELGLISKENTGVELRWGDPNCILTMLQQIVERQGFGGVLADGVAVAAAKIGKGAEKYAVHVAGQSLPMHDPKNAPGFGATYVLDPTPGRHTAGGTGLTDYGVRSRVIPISWVAKHAYARKGRSHALSSNLHQVVNCTGVCVFLPMLMNNYPLAQLIKAATGWDMTMGDLLKTGERIQMLRHCFNLREGFKPSDFQLPVRALGEPPLTNGPLKGRTINVEAMRKSCLKEMGLDEFTGRPASGKIRELELEELIQA